MQYRTTAPQDHGFDTEIEETVVMRNFIQSMMSTSDPGDLLDSVLVVVNICEQRALVNDEHSALHRWYITTSLLLRNALDLLACDSDDYCPAAKLENPMLYFPQVERYQ